MYLMSDFAYKDPDWMKVLNKWWSKTKDSLENEYNPINEDRLNVISGLRGSVNVAQHTDKKPKLEFLKKVYIDKNTKKKRKVVTGIAEISEKSSKRIDVPLLVGNPASQYDDRFSGALDSLDKKVGKRKIYINGVNDEVNDMYKKKFGDRKRW